MAKVRFMSLVIGLVIFLLMPFYGFTQTNPQFQFRDIIDAEFHSSTVKSVQKPTVISKDYIGDLVFNENPINENLFEFTYRPGKIEANTKVVIEYWTWNEETQQIVPDYTTFHFRITRSLITCNDDRRSTLKNTTINGINVLENDTHTHGPLILESILYTENGLATINGSSIDFTPNPEFSGDAYIYYGVRDSKGKGGSGILKIKVVDETTVPEYDEINIVSFGGVPIEIDLPYNGFELEGSSQNGEFVNENGRSLYKPYSNNNSSEVLTLVNNNCVRTINVQVIKKDRVNSWVVDDLVYTSKGTPVNFNVEENDLKQGHQITEYSSELEVGNSNGEFNYTPEEYFSGSKTFEYTVYNGYESETGKIHLKVNNFYPQTQYDYNFTAVKNSALIIEYLIPISNYSFDLTSEPSNGRVSINTGSSVINMGCAEIAGTNLVMYEPDMNFTGSDAFTLNYCVDGNCSTVEIAVEVANISVDDCQCYTGCVWSGDANNDGLVNVVDLLSMAYAIGTSGAASSGNENDWLGRNTEDWIYNTAGGLNAKFADADGNGIVNEMDFDFISDNYDKNHALVPPQLLDNKSFPFSLTPIQDTVYVGDLIEFEIGIGNVENPALDVNGIAYSLGLPASLVDSASLNLEYYNDSWLAIDEAVYGIYNQVADGWLETAIARLGASSQSGHGELGKLDFIVEEDLVGGFRISNGILPISVKIENGQVLTLDGQMANVPGAEATVYLDLRRKKSTSDAESRLIAFPNPASNNLNLHMNGGHEILSYEVFDMVGKKLMSNNNLQTRDTSLPTSQLGSGTYIIRAITTFGPRVVKFEVVNN